MARRSTVYSVTLPPTDDDIRVEVAVISGADMGRSYEIDERIVSVGSGEGMDLRVHDSRVSARHLSVERYEGRFIVRDLGSKNGTVYLGSLISEATLPLGATIEIGGTVLRLQPIAQELDLDPSQARRFGDLVGESLIMREVFAVLELAAQSEVTVLVTGETGTGKELVARGLHANGDRHSGPFVAVDCGSMPEGVLESELFGHVKGAFTGAERSRRGAFARAHGGTLFLDELGGVPEAVQSRLLRAIETRTIRPVGADDEQKVDLRIVAATTEDLNEAVAAGRFRADLYYRLSVLQIELAPLRHRIEDIEIITKELLRQRGFADWAVGGPNLERLRAHTWPGNVRELRNVIDRALALSPGATQWDALKLWVTPRTADDALASVRTDLPYSEAKEHLLDFFERTYLRDLLARTEGNISAASREADIDRKHLRALLRKHRLI